MTELLQLLFIFLVSFYIYKIFFAKSLQRKKHLQDLETKFYEYMIGEIESDVKDD